MAATHITIFTMVGCTIELATGRTLGRTRAGKTFFVVKNYKIFIPGNILVTVATLNELVSCMLKYWF